MSTVAITPATVPTTTHVVTNRATNPSFETNTAGWTASAGSGPGAVQIVRDLTRAYVGGASGRADFPAANQDRLITLANLSGLTLTGVPHVAYGRFKVWLALGKTIPQVLFRWQYTDATVASIATNNIAGTGDWQDVSIGPLASNPAKTVQSLNFYVGFNVSAPAAPWSAYYDAVDIRIDDGPVDTYIDGDQGAAYAWTGTPHASTSRRTDTLVSSLHATVTVVPLLTATCAISPALTARIEVE